MAGILRGEAFELKAANRHADGVLFMIWSPRGKGEQPLLLLTKRSSWVRQPGDLCCPGGRIHPSIDRILGWALRIRGSPLVRSQGWRALLQEPLFRRRGKAMYWACCLRESWEEMGLRPWRVEFMGLLPIQRLRLFEREILPMVGWINGPVQFRLNREVSRIVPIPISSLLRRESYGLYAPRLRGGRPYPGGGDRPLFPCYVHGDHEGQEVLWGATYQIAVSFLERVYGFRTPSVQDRPVIQGILPASYITGKKFRS